MNKDLDEKKITAIPFDMSSGKALSKVRAADSKEERGKLFKKYQITLTKEEKAALKTRSNEVPDAELDEAAGGCCQPACHCYYGCG